MQDREDANRGGRARLAAVREDREPSVVTDERRAPVVPADHLLRVAGALSDGALRIHEQLQSLDPLQRDAIVALMTEQMTEVVSLWAELVRGVVSPAGAGGDAASSGRLGPGPEEGDRYAGRRVETPLGAGRDPEEHRGAPPSSEPAAQPEHDLRVEPEGPDVLPRRLGRDRFGRERFERDQEARARAALGRPAPEVRPRSEPVRTPGVPPRRPQPARPMTDEDRSARDELTGVLNRQAGFAALGDEMDRCRRSGERFVLGFLNVDGLKAVNDARGTEAGDELLRKVTAALRATLRSYDLITRLGGDEFIFSLPGADTSTADVRFKEFAVILAEAAPGTSASVGFAELRANDTLDDLVSNAETALLKARRARRRGRP